MITGKPEVHLTNGQSPLISDSTVVLTGDHLRINEVVQVARSNARVALSDDQGIHERIQASSDYINEAVSNHTPIYGVTSGFGGMSNVSILPEEAADLQNNAIWYHKAGAGAYLPIPDVRAAMLLRANSHMRGVSGIRLLLIQRIVTFLNAGVTPHVREFGSIGASGDLVPLTSITGALLGTDPSFTVDFAGKPMDCLTALRLLNLPPVRLLPKEGLAMLNGTSVMTGIAANVTHNARMLLALTLETHALMIQGLRGTNQSFHPFIHNHKAHRGQVWAAEHMISLLSGSTLSRDELDGQHEYRDDELIQDRYSLRCLPQYLGPIIEGIAHIVAQIHVEMNSANDNPLIDGTQRVSYHGGNFLGQYIGVGMDQLRYYIGLLAKHLDVQIALLVTPQFSNGLSPSLVGNQERRVNMGLKGLQLSGNSIMPMLTYLGNSLADRFPTHAEQFNQNINSQGFGSANLARQSIEAFQQYLAIATLFAVQAVDLRTFLLHGHYRALDHVSPMTSPIYQAIRKVLRCPPSAERPLIWNDDEQMLDSYIQNIVTDISSNGVIAQAVQPTVSNLEHMIPL